MKKTREALKVTLLTLFETEARKQICEYLIDVGSHKSGSDLKRTDFHTILKISDLAWTKIQIN